MHRISVAALERWGLSVTTATMLSSDPETVSRLAEARSQPNFPDSYQPIEIDVLYDEEIYVQAVQGEIVYLHHCSPKYLPVFVEVQFDRQLAMFLVNGELVVDRTPDAITLTQFVKRLQ